MNMPLQEQTADAQVREDVELLASKHALLGRWTLQFVTRHSANSSQVLEYRRLDQPDAPRLMVKHRNRRMSREESARKIASEFQTLKDLWNRASVPVRTSIPRPLALFPEAGAEVLEAVTGTQMTVVLRRDANRLAGWFCKGRLCRMARRSGEWLLRFHQLIPGPVVKFEPARYLANLSHWLKRSQSAGLEESIADVLWETASRASEELRGAGIPTATIHGDFIPQNIFVSRDRVSVIDFASVRRGEPIYEDLGLFAAYLRLLASARVYSRHVIMSMIPAFVGGYGEGVNARFMRLYVLKATAMIFADQFAAGDTYPAGCEKISRIKAELARTSSRL